MSNKITKERKRKALEEIHRKLTFDLGYFAQHAPMMIKPKSGNPVPLKLNNAQRMLHAMLEKQKQEKGFVRALVLKGRQQGISTYINARFYHHTRRGGVNTFILSHEASTTDKLFKMVKRFHEGVHDALRPDTAASNRKELIFKDIDSEYFVGTAGNKNVGRGGTVQMFHGCVAEDSLVILSDGSSKEIQDIKVGDEVVTSSGAFAPVSLLTHTGRKQVYEISTWMTNETIEVSKDHKILTDRGWKKLEDIDDSHYIMVPSIPLTKKHKRLSFKIENTARPQGGGSKHLEEASFDLDYNAGFYFGYYLAEGHCKRQWRTKKMCHVQVCFHENEDFLAPVLEFAQKYATSIQEKHIKHQHKKTVEMRGTWLAEMTNYYFGRVDSKNIPKWVFSSPREFILGLIDGYYSGDGSKKEVGRTRAPSVHERIARQMKRLVNSITDGVCGLHKYERSRYGVKNKDVLISAINGRAYDELFGVPKEKYRNERFKTIHGKKFVKIRSIKPTRVVDTYDIEVDHDDHDFETPVGIISNSECAFWENTDEIESGVMESVAFEKGTEIILESTANGMSGMFYEKCMNAMEGRGDYILCFIPWFVQEEYRRVPPEGFQLTEEEEHIKETYGLDMSQMAWRRFKIDNAKNGLKQFQQEYPCNVMEAFQTSGLGLIDPEKIMEARKCKVKDVQAPLIFGVDPARTGGDKTVIVFRRGREVPVIMKWDKMNSMRLAGIVARLIDKYMPAKVFIDVGYGFGTIDRLKEMGYSKFVDGVNFGSRADQQDIYANKRAEMWIEMRDWIQAGDVNIPDDDILHADLSIMPDFMTTSNGKMQLIGKDKIRKEYHRSPDVGDALALTFAAPVRRDAADQRPVKRKTSGLGLKKKKNEVSSKVIMTI